nr:MAG TPA: DNA-directed primase/polymerase [Caudoviricetes sp.]
MAITRTIQVHTKDEMFTRWKNFRCYGSKTT